MTDKSNNASRLAAERIHALINSRPHSPTVQEIEAIIREVTPEFRVVGFGMEDVNMEVFHQYWRSRPVGWFTLSDVEKLAIAARVDP